MWNVARIRLNISLAHVLQAQQDRHNFTLLGTQTPLVRLFGFLITVQVPTVSEQCAL